MVRAVLRACRQDANLSQQEMAAKLRISLRHYQRIENGECTGKVELWDDMEYLFGVPQQVLRQTNGTLHSSHKQ